MSLSDLSWEFRDRGNGDKENGNKRSNPVAGFRGYSVCH